MRDEETWGLVAVKRNWVPNWLFEILAWPVDLVRHQPLRWLLTTNDPKAIKSAQEKAKK
jgi:hypothetical protein